MEEKVLFVSGTTSVGSLAGSIINAHMATGKNVSLRSVGAGALNQAMKAVILARKHFEKNGQVVYVLPDFRTIKDQNSMELTVIELVLQIAQE